MVKIEYIQIFYQREIFLIIITFNEREQNKGERAGVNQMYDGNIK